MAEHSTIGERERRKWNRGVLYHNRLRGKSGSGKGKRLARVTTGHISITSGSLVNWESTQVNSTGVPWVMYWGLYTIQEYTQTKLCYEWQPIANEEQGKGLSVTNGKRGAYYDKDSPAQLLGRRV